MITVAPSQRILRLNQGELAPGRQADWVLLDLARPSLVPTRLDNLTGEPGLGRRRLGGRPWSPTGARGQARRPHQTFLDGTRPTTRSWPKMGPVRDLRRLARPGGTPRNRGPTAGYKRTSGLDVTFFHHPKNVNFS